ncbi:triacylglycerol lipase [Sinimarinibacterium sp. NLF-5-8]|uniref:esterase/lipase family protein n=1 Tax=Sinimarinibacterium sp. NLF-5-8 TaxID=2698684 RepID=UPI00137BF193|nr:alpha/beta fold hydrolase [Sinimarinibacterium sp. NLF-5-8]QHS09337.1 alpha/beta fold hydrolase [Sinimarinibacterium sp. NLF-5-8]
MKPAPTPTATITLAPWRGAVDLSARTFSQLTQRAHGWHRAISDIPFSVLKHIPVVREFSTPVRALHDGITDAVYTAVDLTGSTVLSATTQVMQQVERSPLAPTLPAWRIEATRAISAISGFVGDDMATRRNPLTPKLGFYLHNQRLELKPEPLRAAYPDASQRLAVFVHGLCCEEHVWHEAAKPAPDCVSLIDALRARGYTPVFARYNSGLHISQNGRGLARALGKLVTHWPRPVDEIVLIGHSMGGLVSRACAHSGLQQQAAWTHKVSHIFCIGSPHRGAPLEQLVHRSIPTLKRWGLTRPLAHILQVRSAGIKDLRSGTLHDGDWRGCDLDAVTSVEDSAAAISDRAHHLAPRNTIARIPTARYHFIGSTLSQTPDNLLSRTLGDGIVDLPSATAAELADASTATLTRVHHLRLLNHPLVWQWMQRCLDEAGAPHRP